MKPLNRGRLSSRALARRFLIASIASLAITTGANAQSSSQRLELDRLRDSVNAATTAANLESFERNGAAQEASELSQLRRSIVALRLGELTGDRDPLDAALRAADDASRAKPEWPYPWFLRALVKLALSDRGFPPKAFGGQSEGERYYPSFVKDATRAFSLDPAFPPLLTVLTDILTAEGDREQPRAFIDAIQLGVSRGLVDARGHLILGRAARTARDDRTALDEFVEYGRAGGDTGLAALESARTLAGMGRLTEAAAQYLRGAAAGTSAARQFYREDLGWVAQPQDLVAYDSAAAAALRPWLEAFWNIRGAESLRSGQERLAEHLRRWAYVYRYFRVVHPERLVDFAQVRVDDVEACSDAEEKSLDDYPVLRPDRLDDHRAREPLLDHRAVVYMRHGEPWRRVGTPEPQLAVASATAADQRSQAGLSAYDVGNGISRDSVHSILADVWLYWFADHPRIFYFGSSRALGPGPTTLYTHLPLQSSLLYLLGTVDPVFTTAANRVVMYQIRPSHAVPLKCMMAIQELVSHTRDDVTAGVLNESYSLLFRQPLGAIVQSFVLGEPALGTGRVLFTYAVPKVGLARIAREDGTPGFRYSLRLRASAVDARRSMSVYHDTITAVAEASPDSMGFVSGTVDLGIPAGRFTVRMAVSRPQATAGTVVTRHDALLGDGSPGLSDIIPTVDVGGVLWHSARSAVRINALGGYPEGGTAAVYYEVYGLDPGAPYRTILSLQQYQVRHPQTVTLSFLEAVTGPRMEVRRNISLARLGPGQYELTITVEDGATRRRATRKQLINVMRR